MGVIEKRTEKLGEATLTYKRVVRRTVNGNFIQKMISIFTLDGISTKSKRYGKLVKKN